MASTSKKKMMLRSSDGKTFEVEEAVAVKSQTINEIHLLDVNSKILSKVLEYCKKHVDSATDKENNPIEIKAWDADFVKAAEYLKIQSLLDLTSLTVADKIKGKTPEEIRKVFNIRGEFTPEEEEMVRRTNLLNQIKC
ncbi:hypothetical protein V6N13_115203 [Hibiscus sabdariffa]|uniref:SKP1-like protein n=1 Tax=Hibiscus sabdariffa TaxID=183260 RepID=A0ABR2CR20_9ROSI